MTTFFSCVFFVQNALSIYISDNSDTKDSGPLQVLKVNDFTFVKI